MLNVSALSLFWISGVKQDQNAQSWRELLIDIGLEIAPDLAVDDGALGFWRA